MKILGIADISHNSRIVEYKNQNYINNDGEYVLYWMQQSQRYEYNYALDLAILSANKTNLPLLVVFFFLPDFPDSSVRNISFMLEGLIEVEEKMGQNGINFIIVDFIEQNINQISNKAQMIFCDYGYLKYQKQIQRKFEEISERKVIYVDNDTVVPFKIASVKEEYSAATIRKKILKRLSEYLVKNNTPKLNNQNEVNVKVKKYLVKNLISNLNKMSFDQKVAPSVKFNGGRRNALQYLNKFFKEKINNYDNLRNEPSEEYFSNMSPYLHFGQISPVEITLKVQKLPGIHEKFLDELIVRRELSINFVNYNSEYDNYSCIPDWAKISLRNYSNCKREYLYALREFEDALTHDEYWNAAQVEMKITGKMHAYMRMYWGKKIIEWTEGPEIAYKTMIFLNNKYSLDGCDANSYAGVAWCFGKHDRAFKERNIFGKVRYMNAKGLERKFKIKKYVENIKRLNNSQ